MNRLLAESDVEQAAIEWLQGLNYTYIHGSELHRPIKEVVLIDNLEKFITTNYRQLSKKEIQELLTLFLNNEGLELDYRNRDAHLKITKGIDYHWKDKNGEEHFEHIWPINFQEPGKNEFLCVNQFPIEGKNARRPDLIIFINGIPLIVFEFKNPFELNATVDNAFNQIQHYREDIPKLFEYNAITVLSDGEETLMGMYSSGREWFSPWKSIDGLQLQEGAFALHCLLQGLFRKDRLLHYIRHFIFHEDHGGKLIKKGAKYHQFFGINFAVEATLKAIKPIGDGRIGVIWHTQGAGKSITMAIYTGILRQIKDLRNPTILVQVDRRDLDTQLYENFLLAGDLVGDVKQADSTEKLRELLDTYGGGVIFSTIEKFRLIESNGAKELVHPVLSDRENIIVIADEAHRTQYGLLDGYASNLRSALPNASYIGFTGTPVDKKDADTREVFGETIHVYDIRQAVEDKATVPIYYEARLAKLHLANENIDEEAEEIVLGSTINQSNRIKWAALEDAAGSNDRVHKIASDILSHYLKRTETLPGKAMIVCMSRRNCVKMFDAISAMEGCPEIAVVMTGNISSDPPEWNKHLRTSEQFEAIKSRFKDPDDPLKLVIVRDMWLTGFDAPSLHTMYVDKVMQDHNLMQAIARVNRVFEDKNAGLIVDYIGIGDRLKDAAAKYTQGGGKGDVAVDTEAAFSELVNLIQTSKQDLPEGTDYSSWRVLGKGDKLLLISKVVNHIIRDEKKADDYCLLEQKVTGLSSMVKSYPAISQIAIDILFIQHVGVSLRKLRSPVQPIKQKEELVKSLIQRSIESDDIVDVFAMAGIEKPDISIINEEFLIGAKSEKSGQEIKVELLRKILNDEILRRMPKNIIKYVSLKDQVDKIIDNYHKNAIDSYMAILKLIEQAKEMQDEDKRKRELGLSDEELAFYDILALHKDAISDYKLIKDIVLKVTKAVKNNLEIDWYKKESARAAIRLAVKKELRGKVSLEALNAILAEVLEQAEGQYRNWPMVG
jgi:type I restriction enzyme, R subunit